MRTTFFKDLDEVLSNFRVKELDNAVLNCKLTFRRIALVFSLLCCDHGRKLSFELSGELGIVSFGQDSNSGLLSKNALEKRLSCQCPKDDIGLLISLLERQKAVLFLAWHSIFDARSLQNLKRLDLCLKSLGA